MAVKILYVVEQGTYFSTFIDLTDDNNDLLNVAGYTVSAKIKKHHLSVNSVSFATTLTTGLLQLELQANTTLAMEPGRYVFAVDLSSPTGKPTRIMEGPLVLNPGV